MKTQVRGGERNMPNKEMQDEMVGILNVISIVSKRLANRLLKLDEENEKEGENQ